MTMMQKELTFKIPSGDSCETVKKGEEDCGLLVLTDIGYYCGAFDEPLEPKSGDANIYKCKECMEL